MEDYTRSWKNLRLGGSENLKSWNGAVVAHPDGTSIQEALNEVEAHGVVIVVGEHVEHTIQIPNKPLSVQFFGGAQIVNEGTSGEHTLIWPHTRGSVGQIWYRPRLIGNPNSGSGLHTDVSDSETQRLSFIEPFVIDHGGPGLLINSPILLTIKGYGIYSQIRNNGQAMDLSRNIWLPEESPPGILGTTLIIENIITRGADINIDLQGGVGHYLGKIIDLENHKYSIRFGNGGSTSVKDTVRASQIHWCYFEDSTEYDVRVEGNYSNVPNEPNLQTGAMWWDQGPSVPYQPAGFLWYDVESIRYADNPTEIYQVTHPPTVTADYPQGLGRGTYEYYRSDLKELRSIDPDGDIATIASYGT